MTDAAILWEWTAFAVRWLHVITAIAWIGSSFYFIALDLGLNRNIKGPADGEEWQVHGGGFYHIQKYLIAPEAMPEHLTWFKWESYATWLSGFALLAVVYWYGAELFLLDATKADLSPFQGIALSLVALVAAWVFYDLLCKSPLKSNATAVMLVLFAGIVLASWGLHQVFSGRAANLLLGAMTATLMTGNVAMVIIPNQKIVVADLKEGRTPDAKYGQIAKLRSTHNNYLTLPVVFLMLSNHYPLSFATDHAWIIAALIFLLGVSIRHFFNSMHAKKGRPYWAWAVTVILFIVIACLSTAREIETYDEAMAKPLTPFEAAIVNHTSFDDGYEIVVSHCSMCHAREPVWDGIGQAPKAVYLETPADVARNAHQVYVQAGLSHAMPPPGALSMAPEDRAALIAWFRDVRVK